MTLGDMVTGQTTLLSGQSMVINPSSSAVEWAIHNIYIPLGATCEVYKTNGSLYTKFIVASTSLLSYNFHCNSESYITVKNTRPDPIEVAFDGIIMQE
jgi:hypothetical protein